ncbi:bifunctional folylpolyglutamate synthase/dihydrofolate synthase [Candidatus Desantisbacteria bacterium]|nr:bifunctional folylpolyglutamate synthase/dihydrofolate synthase [Candidatus Desantisbacteria bacterium]
MNYEASIAYFEELGRFGIQLGLERVIQLLELMGNPHKNLKYIHVAGTNGKGSTVAFLASILKCSGYRVGVYTSPHLIRFNERIAINDEQISDEDVVKLTAKISELIKSSCLEITYFEAATALAFAYFAQQQVDIVVLEVGLGGRLDATNVIIPLVSVITNISLEHTDILGNTVELIAREKAGIIKQEVPVVCGVMDEKAVDAIQQVARQNHASLYLVTKEIKIEGNTIKTNHNTYAPIKLALAGYHQMQNAACAILAAEVLASRWGRINYKAIPHTLNNTHWPGRLQIVGQKPLIVVDGAHNPAGTKVLRKAMEDYFDYSQLILVLGILDDKDKTAMMRELIADNERLKLLILTKPKTSRAFPPDKLLKEADKYCVPAMVYEDIPTAMTMAIKMADENDMICLAGSLYVAAEVLEGCQKR